MDPTTLAGTAITAIVTGALTKAGEPLGKGISDKAVQLLNRIKNQFKVARVEGLITQLEENPNQSNIDVVKTVLASQLSEDKVFAKDVLNLLKQIHVQPGIQQIAQNVDAEGDITAGNINQISRQDLPSRQSISNIMKSSKGKVDLGDINQEQ